MSYELYKPSTAEETKLFIETYCDNCKRDDPENGLICRLMAFSRVFNIYHPRYPKEWVIKNNEAICLNYERR